MGPELYTYLPVSWSIARLAAFFQDLQRIPEGHFWSFRSPGGP